MCRRRSFVNFAPLPHMVSLISLAPVGERLAESVSDASATLNVSVPLRIFGRSKKKARKLLSSRPVQVTRAGTGDGRRLPHAPPQGLPGAGILKIAYLGHVFGTGAGLIDSKAYTWAAGDVAAQCGERTVSTEASTFIRGACPGRPGG